MRVGDESLTEGYKIQSFNNCPFSDYDQAMKMRNILTRETEQQFLSHPNQCQYRIDFVDDVDVTKGYVITRSYTSSNKSDNKNSGQTRDADSQDITYTHRQALLSYFFYLPLIILTLIAMLFARGIWSAVLNLEALNLFSLHQYFPLAVQYTKYGAKLFLGWLVLNILFDYYGTILVVDDNGITINKGIFTRNQTSLRHKDIRTINIRQGLIGKMLGIGTLEFASSGTDDVDIQFFNIANPGKVKQAIDEMFESYK